jgi:hypothetical protein
MESSECTSVSLDDKKILKELEDKNLNKHYVKMMEFRQKLPSYARREVILDLCIIVILMLTIY